MELEALITLKDSGSTSWSLEGFGFRVSGLGFREQSRSPQQTSAASPGAAEAAATRGALDAATSCPREARVSGLFFPVFRFRAFVFFLGGEGLQWLGVL